MPDSRQTRKKAESWWQTLPGLVTGVAALITAVARAIAGLYQAGIFKSNTNRHPAFYSASPESLSRQGKPGDELSKAQWIFQV